MSSQADDKGEQFTQKGLFESNANDGPQTPKFPVLTDSDRDKLLVCILALSSLQGVGFKTIRELWDAGIVSRLANLDTGEAPLPAAPQLLLQVRTIEEAFLRKKDSLLEVGTKAVEALKQQQIWFAPIGHSSYPSRLRRLVDAPRWIFGLGNIEVTHSNSIVAVVGTREASKVGQRLAYQCAAELANRNVVVLSGLAKGIDENAHLGAVEYYGQSIAVLGQGLSHLEKAGDIALIHRIVDFDGAIISEYLPKDTSTRTSFLRRNELQVAMSRVVIPVESPTLESGTGATIRRALSVGTPIVGVFPGGSDEKSLVATRANLTRMNITVLEVMNAETHAFWNFLTSHMADHDWQSGPGARQDRLFRFFARQLVLAQKKVDIDAAAISRLIELLRKIPEYSGS